MRPSPPPGCCSATESRLSVSGSGLDLPLEQRPDVFDNLDGFDEVDIRLTEFRAGPFAVANFELTRAAPSAPYRLALEPEATPGDLAEYGASLLGLAGGPLLRPSPPRRSAASGQSRSTSICRCEATAGGSSSSRAAAAWQGLPTGPLAELITSAIVVQL